jgi:hypothetical protein
VHMGKGGSVSVKEKIAMFEDALVNTGAVVRPDEDLAYMTVRRMQIKLHRWSVAAPRPDQRARHVERPVRGDTHAGCGERAGETDWP